MENKISGRRKFIGSLGLGAASALAFPRLLSGKEKLLPDGPAPEEIRIGLIGAENNHSRDFGNIFNVEQSYPGVRVSHIWGESRALAEKNAALCDIPFIVDEPGEMLGKVNALVVVHRDGKYHLDAAYPFIRQGIPCFIDKPFCISPEKGRDFLKEARAKGAAVSSYSSVAYTSLIDSISLKLESLKRIGNVVIYGPGRVHSEYNGVYYYVVHCLQVLTRLFGDAITRVRITGSQKNVTASLEYSDGFLATMVFVEAYYGFSLHIESNEGLLTYHPTWETNKPMTTTAMVNMFREGTEPRSHQAILNEVSTLEALQRSLGSQQWESVKYVNMYTL